MRPRYPTYFLALFAFIIFVLAFSWWQWRAHTGSIATVNIDTDQLNARELHALDRAAIDNFRIIQASELLRQQLTAPPKRVQVSPFKIAQFETTQGQFASFVAWLGLQSDAWRWAHPSTPEAWRYGSQSLNHRLLGKLAAPANSLSFWDAYTYCRAAGGNLPTVDQWLAAASGADNRSYPWGEQFLAKPWRYQDPMLNVVAEAYPEAATPEDVFNMGSGVSEWALGSGSELFVQMGGNAASRPAALYALSYLERPSAPDYRSPYLGFRCAFPASSATNLATPWGDSLSLRNIAALDALVGTSEQAYLPLLLQNTDSSSIDDLGKLLQPQFASDGNFSASVGEVSRASYRDFLRDPLTHLGFYANADEPELNSYTPSNWPEQLQEPTMPVVGVDWWDAYAFANWVGASLPTEEQWLALAEISERSPPRVGAVANICLPEDCPIADPLTLPANSLGVRALHSNVSEWTSTIDMATGKPLMVVKGGNALLPTDYAANSAYATAVPADFSSELIGIRLIFKDGAGE